MRIAIPALVCVCGWVTGVACAPPQTSHKKTFLYLEQLILKHRAHTNALRIKESHDGIDFFFAQKQGARKMVEFLNSVVPCRYSCCTALLLLLLFVYCVLLFTDTRRLRSWCHMTFTTTPSTTSTRTVLR